MSAIRATAVTVHAHDIIARCNRAVCGETRCREMSGRPVYAGMLPQIVREGLALALTELPGGPADPRQKYRTAYDNPTFILHILGEDMTEASKAGQIIRRNLDRHAHIETEWGIINTISIGPATMTSRPDRPRYDVQQEVTVEFIRGDDDTEAQS